MEIDNQEITSAVADIGQELVGNCDRPDLNFTFKVLSTTMVNAFAGPGGYVYVTTGLLDHLDNKDELASVLAHEIAHISARHQVRAFHNAQRAQIGITLIDLASIFLAGIPVGSIGSGLAGDIARAVGYMATMIMYQGYSRTYEAQADRLGVKYSYTTGFDHHAFVGVFQKFLELEQEEKQGKNDIDLTILRSHPKLEERIKTVETITSEIDKSKNIQRVENTKNE
jgi:predicted Zn-dependent protease